MGAIERGSLPADLVRGRTRFQAWRERRKAGERIPQSLWGLAVQLAKTHGVSRTAAALGLDYYSLKKRTESPATPRQSGGPAFVEFTAPGMVAKRDRRRQAAVLRSAMVHSDQSLGSVTRRIDRRRKASTVQPVSIPSR